MLALSKIIQLARIFFSEIAVILFVVTLSGFFASPVFAETFEYVFEIDGSKVCKDDYKILFKSSEKTKFVCVTDTTHEKLVERGWGFDQFNIEIYHEEPALSMDPENPTRLIMEKKILRHGHMSLTIPLVDELEEQGEVKNNISETFFKNSLQIVNIDYQDIPNISYPYTPKISDDGTSVFLEEHVCARMLQLMDRAKVDIVKSTFQLFLDEAMTVRMATDATNMMVHGKGSISAKTPDSYYDDYCMHELVPGEDPVTIQRCMSNYIKSDDWMRNTYIFDHVLNIGRHFENVKFSPSTKYCDVNYDESLTDYGYANVSADNLRVYLEPNVCSYVWGIMLNRPDNNIEKSIEFCMFYLPYGGNVEKAINCMNYYVYMVSAGDFARSKYAPDENFDKFYHVWCKPKTDLNNYVADYIDHMNSVLENVPHDTASR